MSDYSNIPLGLKIPTQIPLDIKSYIQNEAALINLGVSNNLAYTYVQGTVFYCIEEGTRYEWREVVGSEQGLMTNNFVYSNNIVAFGITYSNKKFNFFRYYDTNVYSVSNIGSGANIYKDTTTSGNSKQFNLRKIKTSNSGTGIPLLKTEVENINDISIIGKTIKSSSLNITFTDNEISIETPTLLIGELKTFYVNSEYIPTINSPSDGSIIRPYLTFDQARTAFIGTGDITTPQYSGSTIVLQTSSSTAINPTINELTLEFQNNSMLTYTGSDLYMFDTEILYSLIPKNPTRQNLTKRIRIVLTGIGQVTRTAGIGLVRGMGSNRTNQAEFGDNYSGIYIGNKSSDIISMYERKDYLSTVWDGNTTNQAGVTYESIYGQPYKYSLQLLPTVPLIYTKYNNISTAVARGVDSKGILNIENLANTSILIDSEDTLFGGETINFTTNTQYIATSSATKMVDFPSYYAPRVNKNYVQGSGRIYCSKITAGRQDELGLTGVDNFFKFTNNANFQLGILDINSVYFCEKFINISDVSNTVIAFSISNTLEGSKISMQGRYFIDTNQASITINMPNSIMSPFLNKSVSVVSIIPNTKGTLSTFFDKPVISGIDDHVDDSAALASGLITNSLYFNTTNNALDKI